MRPTCICLQLRLRASLESNPSRKLAIVADIPTGCPICEADRGRIRQTLFLAGGGPLPRARLLNAGYVPGFILDDMVATGELVEVRYPHTGGRPMRLYMHAPKETP